ncbi:hypothetical protein ABFT26_002008 [Klebsiella pneumoniae]|uniref:hypothetical protein n=1 Tax=Klebsiella pneumoniae TaxID=573 RepID=UPI0015E8FA08|nr:hypothetical protein [Klebsiella pneumoniae]MBD7733972.1 hypothetical protein [Klebsiella pneumoniae]QMC36956.1 hypothetical protein HVZ81_20070 [Klebsiella pneumoniae]HBW8313301.1 hypothetical protein [Klebsiella pneumoniae]HBW8621773.1 hypothetical protein [Klebsiella pneumoniae]HBW8637807.1 hypothetical protein [Klebsiella pneumoniae]
MTITLQAVNELIASLESAGELSIREQKFLKLAKAVKQLAAENVALKKSAPAPFSKLMMEALDTYHSKADDVPELAMLSAYVKLRDGLKTLATDRFVAGIKADGVDEFAAKLRIPGNDQFFDALAKGVALAADDFAKQLREGDDK